MQVAEARLSWHRFFIIIIVLVWNTHSPAHMLFLLCSLLARKEHWKCSKRRRDSLSLLLAERNQMM